MKVKKPVIILYRPQLSENIGMVARAMMNCGLKELYLIKPQQSHLSPKALRASSGAEKILKNAKVFNDFISATADLKMVYATTARCREISKPVFQGDKIVELLGHKNGIIFGPERTGLTNQIIARCDGIINIPLNPEHTSLNLAQAVLLIGYEYSKIKGFPLMGNKHHPADKKHFDAFWIYLNKTLEEFGYYRWPDKKERMQENLYSLLLRMNPNPTEVNTLFGIIRKLKRGKLK